MLGSQNNKVDIAEIRRTLAEHHPSFRVQRRTVVTHPDDSLPLRADLDRAHLLGAADLVVTHPELITGDPDDGATRAQRTVLERVSNQEVAILWGQVFEVFGKVAVEDVADALLRFCVVGALATFAVRQVAQSCNGFWSDLS